MAEFKICYLIDDDPDEQDIFEMALQQLNNGIQLIYEVDSRMAVRKLKRGNFVPHFIFIDINMPQLNGWECIREIRKMEPLADIPITIYSTAPPANLPLEKNEHVAGVIRKQEGIQSLVDVLQRFFDLHASPASPGRILYRG